MSSDIAIKVENLSKCYQIYDTPRDRLKQFILPRLHHLTRQTSRQYFREFWALKDISFEVKKGETVGIVGRNGSGKSTLLQLICGTLNPTSGNIQAHGRIAALLELGSGFNPEFTGRENVYMNASVLGLSKEEIDQHFDDIAAFADIGEFIEQPVKTYSSGMMVRLAFAVIAHVDAEILVVDEALAVGDVFFTQKCMRFIRSFQENGGTLLFVSHDTGAVVNLCSKAIFLKQGQAIKTGSAKEVSEYYLETLYESNQEISAAKENLSGDSLGKEDPAEFSDMRADFINSSNLRNDIEIFKFNTDTASFGAGKAQINSVRLLNAKGEPLSWVVGGEDVILEIRCSIHEDLDQPIIGFDFKDRLGQVVFGDNTYLVYRANPKRVTSGGVLSARFEFRLPILPTGNYSITVAIADGTQESHIQHHWIHEALAVKVHASSVCFGLIGIPMRSVRLDSEIKI